jgi:hypothetical protein
LFGCDKIELLIKIRLRAFHWEEYEICGFYTGTGACRSLERGEEIVASVLALVKQYDIRAGSVSGIGAIFGAVLGFFNRRQRSTVKFRMPNRSKY